jgi:predicted KAP-like P-loop ATPase
MQKFIDEARKLADVTIYSAVSMLGELSRVLPKIEAKKIADRGKEYETEHFATPLSSQRFRDVFEAAIRQAIGKQGRLVVFIDDLDRCEGEVVYRMLESLKLYLNAQNCVYVLGLDQKHLEETIARALSGTRPLAREYLSKMFQCQFLLPVTPGMEKFIENTLGLEDDAQFAVS